MILFFLLLLLLLLAAPVTAQAQRLYLSAPDGAVREGNTATVTAEFFDSADPAEPVVPDQVTWRVHHKHPPRDVLYTGTIASPASSKVSLALPALANRIVHPDSSGTERHVLEVLASAAGEWITLIAEYDVLDEPGIEVDENGIPQFVVP